MAQDNIKQGGPGEGWKDPGTAQPKPSFKGDEIVSTTPPPPVTEPVVNDTTKTAGFMGIPKMFWVIGGIAVIYIVGKKQKWF
jgi:hypothetical protein